MKQTLLLFILLISEASLAGEYSDCILENMKGVNNSFAANQIRQACREKALPYVPAKCKYVPPTQSPPDSTDNPFDQYFPDNRKINKNPNEIQIDYECVNKCLNASYFSKHIGDCKE